MHWTIHRTILLLSGIAAVKGSVSGKTYKLAPEAGALKVGPTKGSGDWWPSTAADVTTRGCLFNDTFTFNADGSFAIDFVDDKTWLESSWQAVSSDGCGDPIAPHDGSSPMTYTYDETASTLTVEGNGAYIGLAKVRNGGEDGNPVNNQITYDIVSTTNGKMVLSISVGAGWWTFTLAEVGTYVPPQDVDVTFQVDVTGLTEPVDAGGIYIAGGDFGQDGVAMTQQSGTAVWSVTVPLTENTQVTYKFRNGPSYGGWGGFEPELTSCGVGQYYDRQVSVPTTSLTIDLVSWGQCTLLPPANPDTISTCEGLKRIYDTHCPRQANQQCSTAILPVTYELQ